MQVFDSFYRFLESNSDPFRCPIWIYLFVGLSEFFVLGWVLLSRNLVIQQKKTVGLKTEKNKKPENDVMVERRDGSPCKLGPGEGFSGRG